MSDPSLPLLPPKCKCGAGPWSAWLLSPVPGCQRLRATAGLLPPYPDLSFQGFRGRPFQVDPRGCLKAPERPARPAALPGCEQTAGITQCFEAAAKLCSRFIDRKLFFKAWLRRQAPRQVAPAPSGAGTAPGAVNCAGPIPSRGLVPPSRRIDRCPPAHVSSRLSGQMDGHALPDAPWLLEALRGAGSCPRACCPAVVMLRGLGVPSSSSPLSPMEGCTRGWSPSLNSCPGGSALAGLALQTVGY